ncbi:MAG TPA: hypothetical protein VKR38_07170 [Usitatibacter sp.]|nr:hypothetical protein [Usitatibacter sp.]
MNTRKALLITSAFVAAASALGSRAADQGFSIEQQMAEGDGYYSQYPDRSPQKPLKPETALQLARDKQFALQMAEGEGYISKYRVQARPATPETARQVALDNAFARQMAEGEGYTPKEIVLPGDQPAAMAQGAGSAEAGK